MLMGNDLRALLVFCLVLLTGAVNGANFTGGTETAQRFGVHEITLTGKGTVSNPFDTPCEVVFTAPSGAEYTVNAFYDGENIWRARCYVTGTGTWSWRSVSAADSALDGKSGSFTAVDSGLRGKLEKDPDNPKALVTDDGNWFLNIGDTPYFLFNGEKERWQDYIREVWEKGITLVRALMRGSGEWDRLFEEGTYDKFNLSDLQTNDTRMIWMLDHYPEMYVEFIILGDCNTG